ncbi:MAG: diacylglycerol/lipid kinase family protein [Acetatifactor sp.]
MYHIIINPASRSGKGIRIWKKQVEPTLLQRHIPYRSYFSEKPGDVAKLTEKILSTTEESPVRCIILGGDGTINEALQGISNPSRVILGYLPTGSSNDFARDLNIPTSPAAALSLILDSGREQALDLGTVTYEDGETRRFAVSCGIGYDAATCEEALRSKLKNVLNKLGLGKVTYLWIALKQLIGTKKVSGRLTLSDNTVLQIDKMFFTVCMIHRFEGGGFKFCPDADATDGIMNMCIAGNLSKLKVLFALPSAFKGNHYRYQGLTALKAESLTIETSAPLWVHTDGEVARKSSKITVSCQQEAIRVIVP